MTETGTTAPTGSPPSRRRRGRLLVGLLAAMTAGVVVLSLSVSNAAALSGDHHGGNEPQHAEQPAHHVADSARGHHCTRDYHCANDRHCTSAHHEDGARDYHDDCDHHGGHSARNADSGNFTASSITG